VVTWYFIIFAQGSKLGHIRDRKKRNVFKNENFISRFFSSHKLSNNLLKIYILPPMACLEGFCDLFRLKRNLSFALKILNSNVFSFKLEFEI